RRVEENIGFAVAIEVRYPDRMPTVEQVAEARYATRCCCAPSEILPVTCAEPPVAIWSGVEENVGLTIAVEIPDPDGMPTVEQVAEARYATRWCRAPTEIHPITLPDALPIFRRVEENVGLAVAIEVRYPDRMPTVEQVAEARYAARCCCAPSESVPVTCVEPPVPIGSVG